MIIKLRGRDDEDEDDSSDDPLPSVPLDLPPCEVVAWMECHEEWSLSLADELSADDLRALFHRFADSDCPSKDVFGVISDHPNAPDDILRALAKQRIWSLDLGLATNPSLPVDVLVRLGHSRHDDVVEHVIENYSTPSAELVRLSKHGRLRYIRDLATRVLDERGIAQTSPDELRRIARSSRHFDMRVWALRILDERLGEPVSARRVRQLVPDSALNWLSVQGRRWIEKWRQTDAAAAPAPKSPLSRSQTSE